MSPSAVTNSPAFLLAASMAFMVAARERQNIDDFREWLYRKVRELHVQKYPYNDFLYPTNN